MIEGFVRMNKKMMMLLVVLAIVLCDVVFGLDVTVSDATSEFNDLLVDGTAEFNDAVTINSNLTVVGDVIVANVTELDVNGSVIPGLDDTFDLGTALLTWDTAYINNIVFGNSSAAILDSPTQSYLRVGDAGTTSHSLVTNDDLFVSGILEVDGQLWVDTSSVFAGNRRIGDNFIDYYGSSNDAGFLYSNTQTLDSLLLGLSSDSNGFLITEVGDIATDFAQPYKINPTVFIQSANATDTDEFMSLEHDQTDARAVAGQGDMRLSAAETVNVDTNFTMGDDSNYLLYEEWVNGTHVVLESYQDLPIILNTYSPDGTAYACSVNNTGSFVCETR